MNYEIGERIELIVNCYDFYGTYEGFRGQNYYGICVTFRDEK